MHHQILKLPDNLTGQLIKAIGGFFSTSKRSTSTVSDVTARRCLAAACAGALIFMFPFPHTAGLITTQQHSNEREGYLGFSQVFSARPVLFLFLRAVVGFTFGLCMLLCTVILYLPFISIR